MRGPTFGSLFAGIGGIDLGLERAGWECRWQVEIDPSRQAVLKKHWPNVKRYEDVRTLPPRGGIECVDLVCGGFPCQPTSRVGRRRGSSDERWLWPEFARILRILRPRFALVENPLGLLDGLMADVLADLAEMGFDAEWGVFPACAFGAPHSRERVFILADADPERRPHASRRQRSTGAAWREVFTTIPPRPRVHAWTDQPEVGRVVDGLSAGVGGVDWLGDAVVPQVAEWIGWRIIEAMNTQEEA